MGVVMKRRSLLFFTLVLVLSVAYNTTLLAQVNNPKSLELNERGSAAAQAGDLKKAEKFFDRSLKADPGNLSAAFNLASIYLQLDKAQQAVDLLSGYTEHYTKDAGLFARLGDAYFANKDIQLSAKSYQKALTLEPSYPKITARLGTIFTLQQDTKQAIELYLKAVKQEPKNAQYLANLSSLFLADKQPQKAVGVAKQALQVRASSDVYITLGTAYEDMKDYKNSLIAFQRAIDLGGDKRKLRKKIEQLEEMDS